MAKIHNPIIPGFNPDPSVCRIIQEVDGKLQQVFYLATSTFEWFPAVCIHRSYDLVNWELITHAVKTSDLLDLKGALESGGSWAPDLTFNQNDGLFYLVYSDIKVTQGRFKDTQNYLITSPSIFGPWSERVELTGSGFDAAMFHEGDKSYLLNVYWDHREFSHPFAGIQLTQYDKSQKSLKPNTSKIIWEGTDAGFTEGPHIYKLNTSEGEFYYLFAAEGGTGWTHRESVARSNSLFGNYQSMDEPLLSAQSNQNQIMQKCGHGSLFQFLEVDPNDYYKNVKKIDGEEYAWYSSNSDKNINNIDSGQWFMAHLSSRQLKGIEEDVEREDMSRGWSILGRETSLQNIVWDNQCWPKVVGGIGGRDVVDAPKIDGKTSVEQNRDRSENVDFTKINKLPTSMQTLRVPFSKEIGEFGNGCLKLYGNQSLASKYLVSLIARRWQSNNFEATTCLSFDPTTYQQSAGLTLFYNTEYWTALHITSSGNSLNGKTANKVIELTNIEGRQEKSLLGQNDNQIIIPNNIDKVYFKVKVTEKYCSFAYSFDNKAWNEIPHSIITTHFSDDYILKTHSGNFTGPFVGIFAYDYSGAKLPADFYSFEYKEL